MYDLDEQSVLISGGSRGIGRTIVRQFAETGADVHFTYHQSEQRALELQDRLTDRGYRAEAHQLDVTELDQCRDVVESIVEQTALDILVNNAGAIDDGPFMMMREESWRQVIDVELLGTINLSRAAIRTLVRSDTTASVVNIASLVGIFGNPGQTNHAAAKAGVIGFTRSLAREVGPMGVRVNAVSPGLVDTDMIDEIPDDVLEEARQRTPLGRLAETEDVASAVLYLASDQASFITGENLRVDGGLPAPG